VDGSCLGSPVWSGCDDIIRNIFGHYNSDFSGFIQGSSDILLVDLYAIYKSLLLARDMNFSELVCYFDSLHRVNLIKGPQVRYHIHTVLIQDIKEPLSQTNVSLYHTLREKNQCADFFAKLWRPQMPVFWLIFFLHKAFMIFLWKTPWELSSSVNSFFL
jgi:hypothetical protein